MKNTQKVDFKEILQSIISWLIMILDSFIIAQIEGLDVNYEILTNNNFSLHKIYTQKYENSTHKLYFHKIFTKINRLLKKS